MRRAPGFRPAYEWTSPGLLCGQVELVASELDVYDLTALYTTDHEETVRRIRGCLWLSTTDDINEPQCAVVAAGLGVASAEAIAAGAVPGPWTEGFHDTWMWHSYYPLRGYTGIVDQRYILLERPSPVIDSRAMRRLGNDHLYFAVQGASDAVGPVVINYNAAMRILLTPSSRG